MSTRCFTAHLRAQFLEDPLLPRLPVTPTPLLQNAIEIFLRLSPSFLDGRNQVLLVRMTEVPRNIGIVQGL